jgi:hypothetical protein
MSSTVRPFLACRPEAPGVSSGRNVSVHRNLKAGCQRGDSHHWAGASVKSAGRWLNSAAPAKYSRRRPRRDTFLRRMPPGSFAVPKRTSSQCRTRSPPRTGARHRFCRFDIRHPVPKLGYFVITPQAIRSPALPAGSDFMSSGLAWITKAVPPLANNE